MSESLDLVSLCCRAHVSRTLHGETPYRCAKCGKEGDAHRPIRPDRGVVRKPDNTPRGKE